MRKLLIAAGFAVMMTSPALAQSYGPGFGTGNVINLPALEHGGFFAGNPSAGAYAYASENPTARGVRNAQALSPNDSDTVYEGGQYVGRDPDPNVRLQLRRDWAHD
jgi:hypothetical protein